MAHDDVARATAAAEHAFLAGYAATWQTRAGWGHAVADAIAAAGDELVAVAQQETRLGTPRLTGEVARTVGQWRLLADHVGGGGAAAVVRQDPDDTLVPPRPPLTRARVPIGPVAVFAASNFPLAFGAPGGDTASAVMAGCAVVVRPHPLQPGTADLAVQAMRRGLRAAGAPADLIVALAPPPEPDSLAQARELVQSLEQARELVCDPRIRAVGFTGSQRGGRALLDLAATRAVPIPVYAEMGAVNPVLVTPGAAAARPDAVATALAGAVTLGVGQFCTKPGVLVVAPSPAGDVVVAALAAALAEAPGGDMLSAGMRDHVAHLADGLGDLPGVTTLVTGTPTGQRAATPWLLATDARTFLAEPRLREEMFGPAAVVVRADPDSWPALLDALGGQLTVTVHADPDEAPDLVDLVHHLTRVAGRLVWNGVPTGVAVAAAQHHGGPYPASSPSWSTSVGTAAVDRWLRAVALQDLPEALARQVLR